METARVHLEEAIREDSLNPLPFHNLSVLAGKQGNDEEARLMAAAAAARGLTFGTTDRMLMSAQDRLARREGSSPRV